MAAGDWFGDIIGNASSSGGNVWKSTTTYKVPEDDFKEVFYKLITRILGSKLPQDTKDSFVNASMDIKEFREYVAEYFPQYAEKIKLWEKLHGNPE